jgi:hypothetical protein
VDTIGVDSSFLHQVDIYLFPYTSKYCKSIRELGLRRTEAPRIGDIFRLPKNLSSNTNDKMFCYL